MRWNELQPWLRTRYSSVMDQFSNGNYSGPHFGDEDWQRITGNYVSQDGYFFMVYCREKAGDTIDADPVRDGVDGSRRFCMDESGRLGCAMEWNGSRHNCLPCN